MTPAVPIKIVGQGKDVCVFDACAVIAFFNNGLVRLVGIFTTSFRVSIAGCFVFALAKCRNAKVVTSDHHQFGPVEKSGALKFEWIR